MKFYIPKYFKVEEVVPKYVALKYGQTAFSFVDARILYSIDTVRELTGKKIIINDYLFKGLNEYRGLRTKESKNYSEFSQHSYGRAIDAIIGGITAEEARQYILTHQDKFPYITRMEDGVTWLHIDCANIKYNGIFLFNK